MKITTYAEARGLGLMRYFTGEPCLRGHVTERRASDRMCCECLRERARRERLAKPDYFASYREKNRDKTRQSNREYYSENAETLREYARQYRRDNADTVRAKDRERAASESRKAQRVKQYEKHGHKNRERENQRYIKESHRIKARVKLYRDENPDKVREQRRPGVSAARARRRKAEGRFTKADVQALLVAQESLCAGCRVDISSGFHVDHIIPMKRGGSNWPSNLQLLCQPCNLSKGTKTMEEWITWKTQLSSLTQPLALARAPARARAR